MASSSDGRQAVHAHPMASKGFRVVLAVEVQVSRSPTIADGAPRLIAEMAAANRTWGEDRIASELLLKLGIRVSPRTVRRYMSGGAAPRDGARSQTWTAFVLTMPTPCRRAISS